MPEAWGVIVRNNSTRGDEYVTVVDGGQRRDAWFSTETDATECARVIQQLRRDSAFNGVIVYKITKE